MSRNVAAQASPTRIGVVGAADADAVARCRAAFERDGVCAAAPVIPAGLAARGAAAVDAVVRGEYDTGRGPLHRNVEPTAAPAQLVKIDQGHWASSTLREVVTHPALAVWIAAITGARLVQVFGVQVLLKPPDSGAAGNVGWHQDDAYWREWWRGEALTAWVALGDVPLERGAMRFVRGSHRWGNVEQSDFHQRDLSSARLRMRLPEGARWEELAAELPAGGVSFHHRLTLHGSESNLSALPRRSVAVHVRTERAVAVAGSEGHAAFRNADLELCPLILGG